MIHRKPLPRGTLTASTLFAVAALTGCGQTGPLSLPTSAQPIERLDPGAVPPAEGGASPPASPDPEDDERADNRPSRE